MTKRQGKYAQGQTLSGSAVLAATHWPVGAQLTLTAHHLLRVASLDVATDADDFAVSCGDPESVSLQRDLFMPLLYLLAATRLNGVSPLVMKGRSDCLTGEWLWHILGDMGRCGFFGCIAENSPHASPEKRRTARSVGAVGAPDESDEMSSPDVCQSPSLVRQFAFGHRPPWIVEDRYEWVWVYIAVTPDTGECGCLLLPHVDTICLARFLATMREEWPEERIGVVLDGSGSHRSDKVFWPQGIVPLPLPPYSPELNPAEQFFRHLRKRLANAVFATLDGLKDALTAELQRLWAHPKVVTRMTNYPWWREGVNAFTSSV